MGQSLPKRDVRVTSVYPSISDIILRRRERREGHQRELLLLDHPITVRCTGMLTVVPIFITQAASDLAM